MKAQTWGPLLDMRPKVVGGATSEIPTFEASSISFSTQLITTPFGAHPYVPSRYTLIHIAQLE